MLLELLFHNQGRGRPIGGGDVPVVPVVPWYLSGGVAAASCLGAWKAISAADIATSYINLITPGTYDLTTSAAPTFAAATGWTFNGTSQFLDTGIAPATGYSVLIRYTDAEVVNDAAVFGVSSTNANFYLCPHVTTGLRVKYISGVEPGLTVIPALPAGILGMAGNAGYRNGVADAGTMGAWTSTTAVTCYIGAYNTSTGPNWTYVPSSKVQACAIYSTTLTAPQMLAVATAMAALA